MNKRKLSAAKHQGSGQAAVQNGMTSTDMMKAVRFRAYGGPEVLHYEDAPRPLPGKGEALIRVSATSVNPIDWKVRAGQMKNSRTYSLPLIPGWDVSGVVELAGPGLLHLHKGDEVYGRIDPSRNGAYAEFAIARETEIALKPRSIDHIHAAAIPLAGLAAWQALFEHGNLAAGERILIHGASGGVGGFAVQFAKWKGAHVIGTAASRNQTLLRELGADEIIDYETMRFEDRVRDVDVVLDTVGGDVQKRSWQVLKKGGILVSIVGQPSEEEAKKYGVRQAWFMAHSDAAQLAEIARLVDEGKLKVVVETVLPLSKVRQAHEMSETRHVRGKIVLTPDPR